MTALALVLAVALIVGGALYGYLRTLTVVQAELERYRQPVESAEVAALRREVVTLKAEVAQMRATVALRGM